MKVTALIPDPLIHEVKHYAKGHTLTDSLVIALSEWIGQQKIRQLHQRILKQPLQFQSGFSASKIREANRRS